MRNRKKFDCVRLKDAIQARRMAEHRGLSDEEITRRIHAKLMTADSPVARLWRAVGAQQAGTEGHVLAPQARRHRRKASPRPSA
jgi:hypothetical protein